MKAGAGAAVETARAADAAGAAAAEGVADGADAAVAVAVAAAVGAAVLLVGVVVAVVVVDAASNRGAGNALPINLDDDFACSLPADN
jgi:hypothetical protein